VPITKEKRCRIIGNKPILSKPDRAGYRWDAIVKYTANAKWILRFVFGAIGNLVIEWA
jgi:hypothetical protein